MQNTETLSEPLSQRTKVYTPEERRQYVQAWSETEDSLEKFCRDHDLETSTFIIWAKKFKGKDTSPFRSVKVGSDVKPSSIQPLNARLDEALNVSMTLPNGIHLIVSPILSIDTFGQLVKAISSWN